MLWEGVGRSRVEDLVVLCDVFSKLVTPELSLSANVALVPLHETNLGEA